MNITDEYIPHFLKEMLVGPFTSFWKDHTISAQTEHSSDTSFNWSVFGLNGAIGSFKCSNNNPIMCGLDFGLAFMADINVRTSLYYVLLYIQIIYIIKSMNCMIIILIHHLHNHSTKFYECSSKLILLHTIIFTNTF